MPYDYAYVQPEPGGMISLLQRKSDGAFIPIDPSNKDYAEFLASGGQAEPAPALIPDVVVAVRPVALRSILRATPDPTGRNANALALIYSVIRQPGYEAELDAFDYAVEYTRSDLIALGGPFGFNEAAIDAILAAAASRPDSGARVGPA